KKPVAKKPVPPPAASWDQPEQPLDPAAMDGRGERGPTGALRSTASDSQVAVTPTAPPDATGN
ncbi:MAG TPA: hypothetical protein PLG23_03800, partial [Thermoflexales bacterium]|nr:hypothetical protein [Thermoflexales bacterium]